MSESEKTSARKLRAAAALVNHEGYQYVLDLLADSLTRLEDRLIKGDDEVLPNWRALRVTLETLRSEPERLAEEFRKSTDELETLLE